MRFSSSELFQFVTVLCIAIGGGLGGFRLTKAEVIPFDLSAYSTALVINVGVPVLFAFTFYLLVWISGRDYFSESIPAKYKLVSWVFVLVVLFLVTFGFSAVATAIWEH